MASSDRSRRNRAAAADTAPPPVVVRGDGPLAELLAERLGSQPDGSLWVYVAYEPGEGLGVATPEPLDDVLAAAEEAGAAHLVVVSSAMVLGPADGRPLPIPEGCDVVGASADPVVDRLRTMERRLETHPASGAGPRVHLLRPAVVVGPGLDSPFVRHFAAPRLVSASGSEVAWQFCHVDDLATACLAVVEHDIDVATVGAPGFLDALDVTRIARRRRLELPESVLLGTTERLHRVGVTPMSGELMRHLVHPWPVEVRRLVDAGWQAQVDNAACLQQLVDLGHHHVAVAGRLVPRREAVGGAVGGAAGITVAALGAAVLIRRSRRRGTPR